MNTSESVPANILAKFNLTQALYSKRELAETCSLSIRTIERLIKAGKINRPVKIGAEVKFPAHDVAQFLASLEAA
jgi:excisionase family DNA binding protein